MQYEVKKYTKYKDSRIAWLGDIPEHWDVKRVKYILQEPLKYGANESAELDDPELPRFVRITDVDESGNLRPETFRSLPEDIAGMFLLEEGDLLFARSGATVGKTFFYRKAWGKAAYAGYLIRARFRKDIVYPDFINFISKSSLYFQWINSILVQATIQNVSAEKYASYIIPLPPLPEQEAIASFLDRETRHIDSLVAKKQKLIELLQEKRTALISHAVTKGLNPSVRLKPSGIAWLGDIPEHWEVKRTNFAFSIQLGKMLQPEASSKDDSQVEYLKALHVQWEKVDTNNLPVMWASPNEILKYSVYKGDLLVCEGGEVGRAGILKEVDGTIIIQNALHRVRSHNNSNLFLLYVLQHASSQKWFEILCNKATIAHFTEEKFSALKIPLPPLPEQEAIAEYLDQETARIDMLVTKIQAAIEKLREYRTALISSAVTGKIDVRE